MGMRIGPHHLRQMYLLARHMKRRSHVTPLLSVELLSESYEMMLSQTEMRKGGLNAVMISSESTRCNCGEMFAHAGTRFTTCSIAFGCCNRYVAWLCCFFVLLTDQLERPSITSLRSQTIVILPSIELHHENGR